MSETTHPDIIGPVKMPPIKQSHLCHGGKHLWSEKSDAEKCCHPDWQRVADIFKSATGFGIIYYGYKWIKKGSR